MQGITVIVLFGRDKTNEKIPRRTACQLEIVGQRTPAQDRREVAARCSPAIRETCQNTLCSWRCCGNCCERRDRSEQ